MDKDLMFSSATCEWATPPELFKALNAEFGFTCDVCATADNAKCKEFYSPEQDGLAQEWTGVCWCNPPYGREIGKWVRKAAESRCTVVMLLLLRLSGYRHCLCVAVLAVQNRNRGQEV